MWTEVVDRVGTTTHLFNWDIGKDFQLLGSLVGNVHLALSAVDIKVYLHKHLTSS